MKLRMLVCIMCRAEVDICVMNSAEVKVCIMSTAEVEDARLLACYTV
jgi:hypothetical protein